MKKDNICINFFTETVSQISSTFISTHIVLLHQYLANWLIIFGPNNQEFIQF